jgi:hypothetical protein
MNDFERIVRMSPAFDKRHSDPSKNYGIHGVELRMVLKGPKGATQFVLYTNWQLPHVTQETLDKAGKRDRISLEALFLPNPADLGYHWKSPRYEGQGPIQQSCEYCDGKPCYYDGSGLNAERIYDILLREGSDGVWRELEKFYRELEEKS